VSEAKDLALIDKAERDIVQATTVAEVLEFRDRSLALKHYAKGKKGGEALVQKANAYYLLTLRRLGEITKEVKPAPPTAGPGRGKKKPRPSVDPVLSRSESLAEAGITKQDASRFEVLTFIPPKQFNEERSKPDASVAKLVKLGREEKAKQNGNPKPRAKPEPPPFEPLVAASQLAGSIEEHLEKWPADVSKRDALAVLEQYANRIREEEKERKCRSR